VLIGYQSYTCKYDTAYDLYLVIRILEVSSSSISSSSGEEVVVWIWKRYRVNTGVAYLLQVYRYSPLVCALLIHARLLLEVWRRSISFRQLYL